MFRQRSLWPILCLLLATSLACALGAPAPQAAPSAVTVTVAAGQPTITLPPAATPQPPPAPADQSTEPSPPTAATEPVELSSTETTAPTATTPTATVTRTPKPLVIVGTLQLRGTIAPLAVSYEVVKITREEDDQALLTLKVIATGGRGGYLYYHDDIQQPGATFNIPGRCNKPFVHTIKVTSSDGQTVALPYHVGGVCPTPTP